MYTIIALIIRTIISFLGRPVIATVCIISLMSQSGCALVPTHLPPPPSEETRSKFGNICVVSARFLPEPIMQLPAKGGLAGAGRGAATWSAAGGAAPLSGGGGGNGAGAIIILAASVVGAAIGGLAGTVAGAVQAEPTENIVSSEAALKRAIGSLNPQESFRDRFVLVAQNQARLSLVVVPGVGPLDPREKTSYGFLAKQGFDTVVELEVTSFGVDGPWDVNPPLGFIMTSRARVVRTADDQELYAAPLKYLGGQRTFCEWAGDMAEPFRAELERAYHSLAVQYVEELFMLYPFHASFDHVQ